MTSLAAARLASLDSCCGPSSSSPPEPTGSAPMTRPVPSRRPSAERSSRKRSPPRPRRSATRRRARSTPASPPAVPRPTPSISASTACATAGPWRPDTSSSTQAGRALLSMIASFATRPDRTRRRRTGRLRVQTPRPARAAGLGPGVARGVPRARQQLDRPPAGGRDPDRRTARVPRWPAGHGSAVALVPSSSTRGGRPCPARRAAGLRERLPAPRHGLPLPPRGLRLRAGHGNEPRPLDLVPPTRAVRPVAPLHPGDRRPRRRAASSGVPSTTGTVAWSPARPKRSSSASTDLRCRLPVAQRAGAGSNGPSASSSGGPGGVAARIVSLVVARVRAT